jgi:hypothetical protein
MIESGARSAESEQNEPLVLGPEVLRKTRPSDSPPSGNAESRLYLPRADDLRVARRTDNECIYFDERNAASWMIYPPRSLYTFVQRSAHDMTVIECRRWIPMTKSVFHQVSISAGCAEHGADCPSNVPLSVAVRDGYNPFL